jgi:Flp pilus assembly pilin Flp
VDHRVEPPAWLPQGAAPEAADPEADQSPAVEDTQAAEDSDTAAEAAPEEFANGNGHDGAYSYSSADPYHYSDDNSFAEGTSYRSPFTPHRPAGSDYAPSDSASAGNEGAGDGPPSSGHDAGDLPGSDLPATGLTDPGMPDVGFPHAAADYADTTATPYSNPAAVPYPATEPLGSAGTATATDSGPGDSDSKFDGADSGGRPDTTATDRGTPFGAAAATAAATMGGISAALRSGKKRSAARFSRGSSATKAAKPPKSAKPARPATVRSARSASGQPRRANLVIARIEPWSVMKFSFLISLVLWLVMFVAVALLYYALSSLGVFAALQRTLASVTSSQGSAGVDLSKWTSATRVLGYTMLLGAVDVVLITAISTVGAVIYNLVTHLGGGIEVTLKETD